MIFLEEVLYELFTAAGIKSSSDESVEWSEDYILVTRSGGDPNVFGRTGRETVDLEIDAYSMSRKRAIKLAYDARSLIEELPVRYVAISNAEGYGIRQTPTDNKQYGYTFGVTITVNQSNPEED